MRELGLRATSAGTIRSVKRHVSRLGLDISHFGSGARWTDTQLTTALAEATSWPQLLLSLGMRPESRRSKEKVKARAARLDLSLDHLARPSRPQTKPPGEPGVLAPDLAHLRDAAQSVVTSWFLIRGLWPAAPAEPRPYDLLLESFSEVKRVQVKTTTCTASSGSWLVSVGRHAGGGDKHNHKLPYRADEVDLFAILDGELILYLIPRAAIAGRIGICLGPYCQFIVGSAASMSSTRPNRIDRRPDWPGYRASLQYSGLDSARFRPSQNALPVCSESVITACHERETAVVPQTADQPFAGQSGEWPVRAPRWTEVELRAATEKATSWADLLRAFGYKPSSTAPRQALRRAVERYGIDTSHFVGQRTWSDQALIEAAKTAETWTELLAGLGLSTASKSSDFVRAATRRLGIDLGRLTLDASSLMDSLDPTLGSGAGPLRPAS
jgi:PD-(D/E)XK endonuclease